MLSDLYKLIKNRRVYVITFESVQYRKFKCDYVHVPYGIFTGTHDTKLLVDYLVEHQLAFMVIENRQNYRKVYHFNENGIYTDDSLVISSYELQKYQEYNDYLELEKKQMK